MIAVLSAASLFSGACLAVWAPHTAHRRGSVETAAGIALVAGLALIGAGLPLFR